jgi:hypothetical protein
LLKHEYPF